VGRRYQFAFEPAAVVLLTFVLGPILTGVVANALYDGLKRFLRPARHTIFQFRIERKDGTVADARLETDDPDALRHAIAAFDRITDHEQLNEWDENERAWKQLETWRGTEQRTPAAAPITDPTAGESLPDWIMQLGITGKVTGLDRARGSRNALISAGSSVLGQASDFNAEHVVFSGFLARAQGLHEGTVAAISAGNPHAAFTLLRAYAENAASILYAKEHPAELEMFWRDVDGPGVPIEEIMNYAMSRFDGFEDVYTQLSRYAGPHALSLIASHRIAEDRVIQWSSAPAFKSDHDAVIACAWVVEIAEATSHLLLEFASELGLVPRRSTT
jgi:hypothetical protein